MSAVPSRRVPAVSLPKPLSDRPLLLAVVAAGLVVLLAIAYVGLGFVDAQVKLARADKAYNSVAAHQNSLNDTVKSLAKTLPTSDVTTATSADMQQFKTTIDQIVSRSKGAQPQIARDDAALADASNGLKQERWLTAFSSSRLDRESTRIGHMRAALAQAKKLTANYVSIGGFFDAYADMAIDFDAVSVKAQASDLAGVAAANEKAKADVATAIRLDKAPGLPPEMDTLLHDIEAVTNDVTNVVNAVGKDDRAAFDAAIAAGDADTAKLKNVDYVAIGTKISSYYQQLIDVYNSEVDKANKS